jgi:hypothetical protein
MSTNDPGSSAVGTYSCDALARRTAASASVIKLPPVSADGIAF